MKFRQSYIAIIALLVLFSCTKEATITERVKLDEVKLLSIGFYEADNPDVLVKDYVLDNIKNNNLVVLLPENIDRKKLIARFAVSANNTVKIDGTVQKSGETINDFSIPKDYILSYGNNNAKYTVSIGKGADYVWKPLTFTYNDSATTFLLKVNPKTGDPFIMFNQSRTSSDNQKAAVLAFEDNNWVNKGEASDGRVGTYYDLAFNSQGVAYASYADYTASTAQLNTVKKFTGGTSWALVGNKGITTSRVTYNALAFPNDNKLLLFSTIDVAGVLARRELGISTYENNAWTTNATIPGRASSLFGYLQVARQKNGVIYLGVFNASSPNSVSLYKYENNTWETLVDQWRDTRATAINVRDFDMDVDNEGNVYAVFADNSDNATYKYRVIKYTAATKAVTPLATYINGASGNLFSFDLAVSPLGVPYLFYRNSSNYPSIVSFDRESQSWSLPHVFESQVADELNLDFAPNGEAYAAYLKNRKFFVHKYSAP
jgi:hypothetical protein